MAAGPGRAGHRGHRDRLVQRGLEARSERDRSRAWSAPSPTRPVVARLSAEIQATLPWFEALLAGRDFLLGDTLGAFDLIAFPFLKYAVVVPDADDAEPFHWILHDHLRSGAQRPRLEGWIARIDALPRA